MAAAPGIFAMHRALLDAPALLAEAQAHIGLYEELRDAHGRLDDLYASSRQYTLGGSYALRDLRLFAGYNLTASSGDTVATAANPHAATRSQMGWIGANYRVLPTLTLMSGLYYAALNRNAGHGTLVTLGAKYDLSRRTSLYGTVASVFNSRNASFSVEASPDTNPRPGATQQGAYAGIIHLF